MRFDFSLASVGLMTGETGGKPAAEQRQVVGYSEVASSETPLPFGFRPLAILEPRTGSLLVGDRLAGRVSEIERLVAGSLRHLDVIGAVLPTDERDEQLIDELMAKRDATRVTRPLRRREGEPK